MSEYPFIHNSIAVAYQEGKRNSKDFNINEFIKNSEEDFEDWVHSERTHKLEKENAELKEAAREMLDLLVNNAPIDGLWLSSIDEWNYLIGEER
jgi:hypothetical protein